MLIVPEFRKGLTMYFTSLILLLGVLFSPVHAQDTLESSTINVTANKKSLERLYEVKGEVNLARFKSDNSANSNSTSLPGLSLSAGRIFKLSSSFSTTTSVNFSYSILDDDIDFIESTFFDLGVSQRLSFTIENGDTLIQPFIEVSAARGIWNTEMELINSTFETDIDYTKLGVALGTQFVLKSGLTPFLKYSLSKINLDDEVSVKTTSLSQTFRRSSNNDFIISSLTVGLGLTF